jgi:hypothetical protein
VIPFFTRTLYDSYIKLTEMDGIGACPTVIGPTVHLCISYCTVLMSIEHGEHDEGKKRAEL